VQGIFQGQQDQKTMSRRIVVVTAVIFAAVCGGAAFVWLHAGGQNKTSVRFTPDPPAAGAAVAAPSAPEGLRGQPSTETATKPVISTAASAAEPAGFAPPVGEVLEFSGSVAKVNNVATMRLVVNGRKPLAGKDTWHLQAFAHTQSALRIVFELDDQFDSYSEAGDFASVQYEMRLSERGQKVQSVQRLTPTAKEPAPPGMTGARVLPGTRDPLGMMQYLRGVDWNKTPEVRGPVYDGHKLYQVTAHKTGSAEVQVPAGKFSATAVEIKVFDNGAEMKDAHFTLYVGKDAARTPALLEATLPFAQARVELVRRGGQ
jgi:hypothetical protein